MTHQNKLKSELKVALHGALQKTAHLRHVIKHRVLNSRSLRQLALYGNIAAHSTELILLFFVAACILGPIRASNTTSPVPDNTSRVYPLAQVSVPTCKSLLRSQHTSDCKIPLPVIRNGAYYNYVNDPTYNLVYSVLRAGTYDTGRDQGHGSHLGVDIATAKGTPVQSIGNGTVIYAGTGMGYGNSLMIQYSRQGKNIYVVYGHLDTMLVKVGQVVYQKDLIGTVGNSGLAFGWAGGNHLHREVRTNKSFAFATCADYKYGDIAVTNQWLCQSYMVADTVDPVALVERNVLSTTYVPMTKPSAPLAVLPTPVVTTTPVTPTPVVAAEVDTTLPTVPSATVHVNKRTASYFANSSRAVQQLVKNSPLSVIAQDTSLTLSLPGAADKLPAPISLLSTAPCLTLSSSSISLLSKGIANIPFKKSSSTCNAKIAIILEGITVANIERSK